MKVKVELTDVKIIFRFIKNFLIFDEEKLMSLRTPRIYRLIIRPNYLLVPVYRYSYTPLLKIPWAKVKHKNKIDPENLSYFRVVKLPEDSNVKIELSLEPSTNGKDARIWAIRINVGDPGYQFTAVTDDDTNQDFFDEDLSVVKWAKGRSYAKYSKKEGSKVAESIYRFEEFLFIASNLLYTLYSGEYRRDAKGAELFMPFTELLQSYGKTFDEALSTIREISALML